MIDRIEKVRKEMKRQNLDAFFITDQNNVSYLTQFSGLSPEGREGFFIITKHNAYLLTFPTYFGMYKNGGLGFNVLNITPDIRLHEHLNIIIEKETIKHIGIEKDNVTIGEFASLKKKVRVKFLQTSEIVEKLRVIKSPEEIAHIRNAAKIGDIAFDFIKSKIIKGISEKDIALELEYFIKKNADDISFPPIIAFNKNAAIPHYMPSKNCHLTPETLILLDFGTKINGYCSDMTRIIFFGSPSHDIVKAYKAVLHVQSQAIKKLKAGVKCGPIDNLAKKYLVTQGYPKFQHGLGHGVGLAVHEAPRLKIDSKEILRENMVVTVEPGIYLENQFGIRIEDLVLLTKDGVEILSKSNKTLESSIIQL